MSKNLLTLIALFFLLSACAPPVTDVLPLPTETPVPDQPSDAKPAPPKEETVLGQAPVDDVEIVLRESFPVQVSAIVDGYLPDACTEISSVTCKQVGDTFRITLATARPAEMACADVVSPYEEEIVLDVLGLAAGVYTVNANGVTASFELQADNELPAEDASQGVPASGSDPGAAEEADMDKREILIGTAPVENVRVEVIGTNPVQAQATVVGYLPDGCTELGEMTQEWQGDTLVVTLTTRRPAGVACTTMITPFEEVIPLDTSGISTGTYTVQVNDLRATLTVQ
jgi:inhibitor of cysteine peptidase